MTDYTLCNKYNLPLCIHFDPKEKYNAAELELVCEDCSYFRKFSGRDCVIWKLFTKFVFIRKFLCVEYCRIKRENKEGKQDSD